MPTIAQSWLEQGRAEGRNEGLLRGEQRVLSRQLELRFGRLPDEVRDRIARAGSEALLLWSERVLTAERLGEVFGEGDR